MKMIQTSRELFEELIRESKDRKTRNSEKIDDIIKGLSFLEEYGLTVERVSNGVAIREPEGKDHRVTTSDGARVLVTSGGIAVGPRESVFRPYWVNRQEQTPSDSAYSYSTATSYVSKRIMLKMIMESFEIDK